MPRVKREPEIQVRPIIVNYGIYELQDDVVNPSPDRRRTRDWLYFPVWNKGTQFIVEPYFTDNGGLPANAAEIMAKMDALDALTYRNEMRAKFQTIRVINQGGAAYFVAHQDPLAFNLLMAYSLPAVETLDTVMAQKHLSRHYCYYVLRALVRMGKLTLDDVRQGIDFDHDSDD